MRMAERIINHRHCMVCGKAIPFSEETCSEECKSKRQAHIKKQKTYIYIMYAMILVLIVSLLFGSSF